MSYNHIANQAYSCLVLIISEKSLSKQDIFKQVKSFNTAHMVKQMSTLMLKYAIYAFSVEKQLKSVLNI